MLEYTEISNTAAKDGRQDPVDLTKQGTDARDTSNRYVEIECFDSSEISVEKKTLSSGAFEYVLPDTAVSVSARFHGFAGVICQGLSVSFSDEGVFSWDENVFSEEGLLLFLSDDATLTARGKGTLCCAGDFSEAPSDSHYAVALTKLLEACRDTLHSSDSAALEQIRNDYTELSERYSKLYREYESVKDRLSVSEEAFRSISSSTSWKMTKPLRAVLDFFKKFRPLRFIAKVLAYIRKYGFKSALRRARFSLNGKKASTRVIYTPEALEAQKKVTFKKKIKFSVLVPLYNTPKKFLIEMIESVKAQTYADWELCLADGSDAAHGDVEENVRLLMQSDSRIVYKKLEKNLGISGNTNACIDMATGDYIALFDHDDLLHPAALYEMMRAIDAGADFVYTDENTFHNSPKDAFFPHYKPDFSPDMLRANNYICHFNAFSKELLEKAGKYFRPECDGSQDYDMMLRLTEQAKKIVHIPIVLYYWRAHRGSVATGIEAKPYVIKAAHKALEDHLKRVGLEGEVLDTVVPSMYRIRYKIQGAPLVSIIIANKDHVYDLDKCITSIIKHTTYSNYEIVIVENNSTEEKTFEYYASLESTKNIRVVTWSDGKGTFNYSAINNYGVKESRGDYVILLNNDIEILSPMWIEEMLMFAQRNDVGAVGAKLYYPDDTIQHAGIGIGLLTLAGHYHRNFPRRHPGYMGRLIYAHNVSAVTAACIMIPRKVWDEVDGLDEGYAVAFNDVDLCMKIREKNYLIIFTPFAEAYHYESKSRGLEDTPEKRARFLSEIERFYSKWKPTMDKGDPYYNPNFTLDREDFTFQ